MARKQPLKKNPRLNPSDLGERLLNIETGISTLNQAVQALKNPPDERPPDLYWDTENGCYWPVAEPSEEEEPDEVEPDELDDTQELPVLD